MDTQHNRPLTRREISRRYYERNKEKAAARHAKWNRTPSGRFHSGKSQAGENWRIGKKAHAALLELPCHYCGGELNETGTGLDRLNPKQPYAKNNVVPCCKPCNYFKGDYLTPDETKTLIDKLREIRGGEVWKT